MGGRKKMAGTCAGHPDQTSLPLLSGIGSVRREAPGGWGAENSEASPWTEPRGNSASIAMHWGGTLSVPGPAQGCIWAEARFLHGRRLRVPTLPAAQAVAACSAIQHPRMHGGRSRACATMTSRTGRPATLRPVAQNFGGRRRGRVRRSWPCRPCSSAPCGREALVLACRPASGFRCAARRCMLPHKAAEGSVASEFRSRSLSPGRFQAPVKVFGA